MSIVWSQHGFLSAADSGPSSVWLLRAAGTRSVISLPPGSSGGGLGPSVVHSFNCRLVTSEEWKNRERESVHASQWRSLVAHCYIGPQQSNIGLIVKRLERNIAKIIYLGSRATKTTRVASGEHICDSRACFFFFISAWILPTLEMLCGRRRLANQTWRKHEQAASNASLAI